MTYTLYIGNKRYSSWSMRPWVLLRALRIPFDEKLCLFKPGQRQPDFLAFSPSGKVPCLHDAARSIVVWDSLAIAEYVADNDCRAAWPSDPAARAFARCAAAEMHAGFAALRDECSMNVALRIELGQPSEALRRDIDRLGALFGEGLGRFGGPWLAGGEFTAVDAFFAPVASRCRTFGIQLDGPAGDYIARLYEHPAVREWIEQGIEEPEIEPDHEADAIRGRKVLENLRESKQT